MAEDIWALERSLWTDGLDAYAAAMAPGAVMAFPDPIGLLAGDAILATLRDAPRWDRVDMTERHEARRGDCLVLAYRARGQRGDATYDAICTSAWSHAGGEWRILSHQQNPAT